MALEAKWVARVLTQVGDEWEIGTAYPIGQNVILTARHVISDINQYKQTCIQWRDDAEKKVVEEHYLQEILYESEKYDLLIARCKTPNHIPIVDISSSTPSSEAKWESHGYPRSGKYKDKKYRHRQPVKGSFFPKQDNFIRHLDVKGDVAKAGLWQGMSGAPVFLVDQNKLVAVIIETPSKDENKEEVYKDRLYAVSLAYVLKHDEQFQQICFTHTKIHNEQYLVQQVKKLATFFDGSERFKKLCISLYQQDLNISSLKLAEVIRDDQINIIQTNDKMDKIANLISDYLDDYDYQLTIKDQAESLFSLAMSLMLINCPIKNKTHNDSKAHYVSVLDEHTLELIASQFYGTTPRMVATESTIGAQGKDMFTVDLLRDKAWNDEQTAEATAQVVYEHIFRGKTYSKAQLPTLNRYIKKRRNKDKQFHYCMVNLSVQETNVLTSPEIVKILKANKMLSYLPIFVIGEEADDTVAEMSAIIYDFYQDLLDYSQKKPVKATP